MVAAHTRFRRLPGAMRVLAVELCHYADTLITCAAAAVATDSSAITIAASMRQSTDSPEVQEADLGMALATGRKSRTGPRFSTEGGNSASEGGKTMSVTGNDGRVEGGERTIANQTVSSRGDAAGSEGSKSSTAVSSAAPPQPQTEAVAIPVAVTPEGAFSPHIPTVASLYGSIVAFVLDMLSDAELGAKPGETAAPLQLHLRCLSIVHWQMTAAVGATGRAAQSEGGAGVADLPAEGIMSLLAPESSFSRLRWAGASLLIDIDVAMRRTR